MIQEEKITCLGKVYDSSLKDINSIKDVQEKLSEWLRTIDNSQLLGRFKVWCYQFGIIPRLQWPFLLYDIPVTQVETMERISSRFLRKWLGVPSSFSSVNLYSKTSKLTLHQLWKSLK